MRPSALFFYIVGAGAPLAMMLADPDLSLPVPIFLAVVALSLGCFFAVVRIDPSPEEIAAALDRYEDA